MTTYKGFDLDIYPGDTAMKDFYDHTPSPSRDSIWHQPLITAIQVG